MVNLQTCLWFDRQAEQAAQRYLEIFPDSEILDTIRYGPDAPLPEGTVLTITLRLGENRFTLLNGGSLYNFSEAISFQILCADQEEVDHYWQELTRSGQPGQCGWLKDEFGVSWQVTPTALFELLADPNRAAAVTPVMMGMQKLDIAALAAAAE
jgi:predicted 3-demethylubiquinone-9 3-methyltransferase (glyoxalase superfamily)